MAKTFKTGEVAWRTPQGPTEGTVRKRLTRPTDIAGHHVAASADNPQLLVQSERSGKVAAHKPGALKKKSR
jgi:hypothetical protein